MDKNSTLHSRESGVAIFYILLGIILFTALAFTFSQGMHSANTSTLNEEEAKVFAQDLISYSSRLDRGVQRVMSSGICSENDISFYLASNAALAGYIHTPDVDDRCKVFHEEGGTITWLAPAERVNDGSNWVFSGHNRVSALETDTSGTGNDLTAFLPNIDRAICMEVNKLVGVANTGNAPPQENDDVLYTLFTGTYGSSTIIDTTAAEVDGKVTGCFAAHQINGVAAPNTYHFYHVLLAR